MQSTVSLRFLGTVEVEREGEPVGGLRSRKALALLGYLAVQDQPVPREQLAELLWEGRPERRGRANLTWVLGRIGRELPGCVRAGRHAVQLKRGDSYWLDVDAFEEMRGRGDVASLAAAAGLYRGEFLEGVALEGCAEFELWVVGERERWQRRMVKVLRELMTHHGRSGEYEEGLGYGRRLLELEPWHEEAHRQVMRLLGWSGRRGAALAQYEACCRVLEEELGVRPAEETVRLYEQVRDGELAAPVAAPVAAAVRLPDFGEGPGALAGEAGAEPVFVAREEELGRLEGYLEGVLRREGRVVFVTGEAGQGKTALIQEFARRAQGTYKDLVVAWGHGNAHTGVGDPYLPFREVLGSLAGDVEGRWRAGGMGRERARRLWTTLPLTVQALVEVGPDLIDTFVAGSALMGRAAALERMTPGKGEWLERLEGLMARRATVPGPPGLQQSNLFEQYTRVMRELAEGRPLVVVLDDLQWVDVGSASLLFHLGRRIGGSRILVVGAYRPAEVAMGYPAPSSQARGMEREREWHPLASVVGELKRRFGEIEIDLGQAEGREFVEAFVDAHPNRLGEGFREMLYRQTLGHPLFTVELVRGMQERGDLVQGEEGRWEEGEALDWETLPARVEAVIGERVRRLGETSRRVLQVASVEGETFTAEVVARVQGVGEREMVERLSGELDREHRLVRARGVERLGSGRPVASEQRLSRYRFRHILFQRYLYDSLDPVERAYLHESVGTALEEMYREAGEGTAAIAVQLARHFREAGVVGKAVDYLREAGERAVRLSAYEEAVAHFTQGLALLEDLVESGEGRAGSPEQRMERARRELMLRVGLAVPLQSLRGYGDPEVGRLYDRARELCRQVGETSYLLPVLWYMAFYYTVRAEYRTACEVGEQLLELAERAGNPLATAAAHFAVVFASLYMFWEWIESRVHLEQAVALCRALHERHATTFLYGQDIGVISLATLCIVLTFQGYPDQGLERGREALARAEELSYPLTQAAAFGYLGLGYILRRDPQTAWEVGETCLRLSSEQGFVYWAILGRYVCGWALIQQGRTEEGAALIQQVIADAQATGCREAQTMRLAGLAEAYGKMGQVEDGLALLDEALGWVLSTDEHFYEPEIYRIRGELFLLQGEETEAEACFQRAAEMTGRLGLKLLELRATVNVCRLWQEQGRREEARERLAEIYDWFTEGFDLPDLQEAKALLEELGEVEE